MDMKSPVFMTTAKDTGSKLLGAIGIAFTSRLVAPADPPDGTTYTVTVWDVVVTFVKTNSLRIVFVDAGAVYLVTAEAVQLYASNSFLVVNVAITITLFRVDLFCNHHRR